MDKKQPPGFQRAKNKAKKYARDKHKTADLLKNAFYKANKNKDKLLNIWDDLNSLFRLIKAWGKSEYTEIPGKTIIIVIGAIIYFINPFDIIPDFIFLFGFLDDAAVIAFTINSIKEDIERFLQWERKSENRGWEIEDKTEEK